MKATQTHPDVLVCSIRGCNGVRCKAGPISGQRMDEVCLVCTECSDETLVDEARMEEL